MKLSNNEFVETKINTKLLKGIALVLLFFALVGINNTHVYYTSLMPFGICLVFALMYIKINGYVLSVLYFLSTFLSYSFLENIGVTFCVCLVCLLVEYLSNKNKIKYKKIIFLVFGLLALVGYIINGIGDVKQTLAMFVSVVLGLFFLISCMYFFDATFGRGFLGKINLDEKICGCVILVVFFIGICNTSISIVCLGLVFATLIINLICKMCNVSTCLICGVLVGLGFSFTYINSSYISLFVVLALATITFKCNIKILSTLSYVLSYIVFCILFKLGLSGGDLLSVIIGGVIYLVIPSKVVDAFVNIVKRAKPLAINGIFNSTKKQLKNRVKQLSTIFKEMDSVYRQMVKGNLSEEKAKEMLKEEVVSYLCSECVNRDRCFRTTGSFMDNCFDTLVSTGYEKGKLLLIDVPEYLVTNCNKVNLLIQYYNNMLSSYMDYTQAISNMDMSRILIAEQLNGVSVLLNTLADEIDVNMKFNDKLEELLKEKLTYINITCLDCVVYETNEYSRNINIIVKKTEYNVTKLENIISKIFKSRFEFVKEEPSEIVGAISLFFKNANKYDIAFGCSCVAKSGKVVSGDNHTIVDLNDGKFMVSICDGMGSGYKANNISKLTLTLVENFYKAGFDNNIILSTVNKLLTLNEQENYSTIDLCVIDCKRNIYDFIKLGASNGYVLRSNGEIEIIESSGLPIGMIEKIKPHITKLCINPMDIVVLVSDGISDVLGEDLKCFIQNADCINPQNLSDKIVNYALLRNGNVAKDDMTVVCVRVFENV